jgi:hypothetical protein
VRTVPVYATAVDRRGRLVPDLQKGQGVTHVSGMCWDERLRFVAGLLEGEKMAAVCEDFGISRETCAYEKQRTH